jgi:hypothetical protein
VSEDRASLASVRSNGSLGGAQGEVEVALGAALAASEVDHEPSPQVERERIVAQSPSTAFLA